MGKRKNRERDEPLNDSLIRSTENDNPRKKKKKSKKNIPEQSLLQTNSSVNNSNEEEIVIKEKKSSKKKRHLSLETQPHHDILGAVNEDEKIIPQENLDKISKTKKGKKGAENEIEKNIPQQNLNKKSKEKKSKKGAENEDEKNVPQTNLNKMTKINKVNSFETATFDTTVENKDKRIKSKSLDKSSRNFESLKGNARQNKKIVFDNDTGEPQDSADPMPTMGNTTKEHKGRNKPAIYTPEEPTDIEIDQFCDEIDEDDNVQYENWIQLIEAKLGPNKKS